MLFLTRTLLVSSNDISANYRMHRPRSVSQYQRSQVESIAAYRRIERLILFGVYSGLLRGETARPPYFRTRETGHGLRYVAGK